MDIYEKIVTIRNKNDQFSKMLGVKSVVVKEGYGRVEADVRPDHDNTFGTIHGGMFFSMADSASACAAFADGMWKTTLNTTFDFLRAGKEVKHLIAEAYEVKKGKSISIYDATVKDQDDTLLARGTFTYFNLHKPILTEEMEKELEEYLKVEHEMAEKKLLQKDLENETAKKILQNPLADGDLEIYFYRHGITECNEKGLFAGVIDPEVCEAGWKNLHFLKEHYEFPEVDHVYASPLIRTQQTASVYFPDQKPTIIEGLHEQDFGVTEGKKAVDIFEVPELAHAWHKQKPDYGFEAGETMLEAKLRIMSAITHIIQNAKENGYKKIAIVSHGQILNLFTAQCFITEESAEAFSLTPNGMGFEACVDWDLWFQEQKMYFVRFLPEGAERPNPKDSPYFSRK